MSRAPEAPNNLASKLCLMAIVCANVAGMSCSNRPTVEVNLLDPFGLRQSAAFEQLAVFAQKDCPNDDSVASGQLEGATVTTVRYGEGFPDIGNLPRSEFAFVGILRRDDCAVLGFGCTPVNLDRHRHITVEIRQVQSDPPGFYLGACAQATEQCIDGACSPKQGGQSLTDARPDGSTQTSCTLAPVGGGRIESSLGTGSVLTGPNVVSTATGFVLAYRDTSADGKNSRAIRVRVTDDGTKGTEIPTVVTACAGSTESGGIAAAWNAKSSKGLMAVTTPPCAAAQTAVMDLMNFDEVGNVTGRTPLEAPDLRFARVQAAAAHPTDDGFYLSATASDKPYVYPIVGTDALPQREAINMTGGNPLFAQVATSQNTVALVAQASTNGGTAGALSMTVRPPTSANQNPVSLAGGPFGSLTAWGSRALVIRPDTTGLAWNAIDVSGKDVGSGSLKGGPFSSVDATTLNDHIIIAAGSSKTVTLWRLDRATGVITKEPPLSTTLPLVTGKATLADYDGARIAIAAARKRVMVAWVTTPEPRTADKVAGGYVLLGCDN